MSVFSHPLNPTSGVILSHPLNPTPGVCIVHCFTFTVFYPLLQHRLSVPCTYPLFPTTGVRTSNNDRLCRVLTLYFRHDRLCCVLTLYFRHRPPVLCTHSLFPTPIACAVYSLSISDTDRLCCVLTLYFRHRSPVLCTHPLFPTPIACAVYSASVSDTDRLMHCLYSRSVSNGHLLVEGRDVQRVSVHRSHGAQAAHPVLVVAGDLHSQSLQRGVRTRIDGDLSRAGRCVGRLIWRYVGR